MADYSEAVSKHATLTASTVDTVTLTRDYPRVEVLHKSAAVAEPIYFTVNGAVPTVNGDDTHVVMPGGWKTVKSQADRDEGPVETAPDSSTVVRVISAGTPAYAVTGEE